VNAMLVEKLPCQVLLLCILFPESNSRTVRGVNLETMGGYYDPNDLVLDMQSPYGHSNCLNECGRSLPALMKAKKSAKHPSTTNTAIA
jgi:hypothetical protein